MSKNYHPHILLVCTLVVLTTGLPQIGVDEVPTSAKRPETVDTIDLPFLQFKNGGIRVNFAGYHAEAGLGGLLGGSDAKGGLFASAGTPWGPSASAGLGGALGGQDGTARGGLHARAGLGNGRPEAAAGLGGSLDGSARPRGRASGGLYAGATAGGPGAVAGLSGSTDGSGTPGGNTGSLYAGATNGREGKITVKETNHVQSVPRSREKVYSLKSGDKEASSSLEFKMPAAGARNEIASSSLTGENGNRGPKYDVAGANAVAGNSDGQNLDDASYPMRRYYRKRNRNSPFRKSIYKFFTTNAEPIAEVPAASASAHLDGPFLAAGPPFDNLSPSISGSVNAPPGVVNKPKRTTLFDDIFNIPISTLTAVNQLLNNKSG